MPPRSACRPMRAGSFALALGLLLLLPLAPLPAPAAAQEPDAVPYALQRYAIPVDGQTATGWVAFPTQTAPRTLLVYAHGCCSNQGGSGLPHGWAGAFNAVVVGMDYRGNGHWNVWTGHRDSIAAAQDLQARFPTVQRTIIWGVSMGGEVSGMAVAARPDLFDYWVSTFGVLDLFQEFGALGLYPGVSANPNNPNNPIGSWILEETGGLPGVVPLEAWTLRSPVHRALEMQGLKRAYLETGVGDLIVYPTETYAMFAGLVAAQVPATLCVAATGPGGVQGHFVPGVGVPAAPTPVGPAAHDGRGFACTFQHLAALLTGGEPDAGSPAAVYALDFTTCAVACVNAGTPVPPRLPA